MSRALQEQSLASKREDLERATKMVLSWEFRLVQLLPVLCLSTCHQTQDLD